MLNHAIEQARNLARGLNPVHITPAGLVAALQKLASDVENAHRVCRFCRCPDALMVTTILAPPTLAHIAAKSLSFAPPLPAASFTVGHRRLVSPAGNS